MREAWDDAVADIRASGGLASPSLPLLYDVAISDGKKLLARHKGIQPQDRRDLVHDVLARTLELILLAENPRAFFLTCLSNQAVTVLRKRGKERSGASTKERATTDSPEDAIQLAEILLLLQEEPVERVRLFLAAALGENRKELARHAGTSPANVDQIVSRMRRRLRELAG